MRREASRLLKAVREAPPVRQPDAEPIDVFELLNALGAKLSRADRSERNKARWSAGDRRPWGGEFRKPYPPGRGSRSRRQFRVPVQLRWAE